MNMCRGHQSISTQYQLMECIEDVNVNPHLNTIPCMQILFFQTALSPSRSSLQRSWLPSINLLNWTKRCPTQVYFSLAKQLLLKPAATKHASWHAPKSRQGHSWKLCYLECLVFSRVTRHNSEKPASCTDSTSSQIRSNSPNKPGLFSYSKMKIFENHSVACATRNMTYEVIINELEATWCANKVTQT